MTHDILRTEAERCLAGIFERFSHRARYARFPLADTASCRVFAATVTGEMSALWSLESRLPPTALILAMIRVCEAASNPSSTATATLSIPRPFAHEMLERLRCELPPTQAFALDQVGRIVNEAGNLTHENDVQHAFLSHRLRHHGAMWAAELDQMVMQIWKHRYSRHAHMARQREAA